MHRTSDSLDNLAVTALEGVGQHFAEKLLKLKISSVQDLLFHLPYSYEDRTVIVPIGELKIGTKAVFRGGVSNVQLMKWQGKRSLQCQLTDGRHSIGLRFFHVSPARYNQLQPGRQLRCFGEIRAGKRGAEVIHPEYVLEDHPDAPPLDRSLTPVYPATEGISQYLLRRIGKQALQLLNHDSLPDLTPDLPAVCGTADLTQALHYLHSPPPDAPLDMLLSGVHPCQRRLAFEELTAHRLGLLQMRSRSQQQKAPVLQTNQQLREKFLHSFGYPLTGAQQKVSAEIEQDLGRNVPMQRLLQGDVGSGKTVVAALAALQALASGYQTAVMAPTEILAEQHYLSFCKWLEPMGVETAWLTSNIKGKKRAQVIERLNSGETGIIVGTHALLQDDVSFHQLGLVVIDEQHRFGVEQRQKIRQKGLVDQNLAPHQLIVTATPIPRTLTMTAYSDQQLSLLYELPPGRQIVRTLLIGDKRRSEVIDRVRHVCLTGKQVYWICTLVEESEVLQCQAAETTWQLLKQLLPELRVGLVHGRFKSAQKSTAMDDFKNGQIDLLVATTVVEVGVDVPNASLMVIENPERLGLAQLHQLRGRVGRGSDQSHCILLFGNPLGNTARQRLITLRDNHDGFKIADKDLELRGPGELLGTRQSGLMNLHIANLARDQDLNREVIRYSDRLITDHPENIEPLTHRWLGSFESYIEV